MSDDQFGYGEPRYTEDELEAAAELAVEYLAADAADAVSLHQWEAEREIERLANPLDYGDAPW